MRDQIQALIRLYKLVTADELYAALSKEKPIKRRILDRSLAELEKEACVIRVRSEETSLGLEGYIEGPNLSIRGEKGLKVLDLNLERRSFDIRFDGITSRLSRSMMKDIKALTEKVTNADENPRKLEMKYFSIALKYHELRGFFLKYDIDAFSDVKSGLRGLRELLDRLEA